MHLDIKTLTKLDLLQEDEDVTKYRRAEDYINGQQQYKFPCLHIATSLPETGNRTNGVSLKRMNRIVSSSSSVGQQPQRSPSATLSTKPILSPPYYSAKPLSKESTTLGDNVLNKRTKNISPHDNERNNSKEKQTYHQHRRQTKRKTNQKEASGKKRHIEHTKRAGQPGLRLLEKFTSPNIEIEHITVKHNGQTRPRMGLFNKGKSSAKGQNTPKKNKYTIDLVFSEASFLRIDDHPPNTPPINDPDKSADHSDMLINSTSRSPIIKLPSFKKNLSVVLSDSHSSKSINEFFEDPPKHTGNAEIPINTITPTTNCFSPDQVVADTVLEPNIPTTIIEPVFICSQQTQHQHTSHSLYDIVDSSNNHQAHRVPKPQRPYYTRDITPSGSSTSDIGNGRSSDTYTWNSNSGSCITNNRRLFSSSASLHAWDSASMISSRQPRYGRHYESTNAPNDENLAYHRKTAPPPSIFTKLEGPKPFHPKTNNHRHRHYTSSSTTGGSSPSKQILPRIRSHKPIYPVLARPQESVDHFEDTNSMGTRFSNVDELARDTPSLWQTNYLTSPFSKSPPQYQLYSKDQYQQASLRHHGYPIFRGQQIHSRQRDPKVGQTSLPYSPSSYS